MVARLPHVRRALLPTAADALRDVDLAVVSTSHPSVLEALVAEPPNTVIDLSGRLGADVEALTQYEGVAW